MKLIHQWEGGLHKHDTHTHILDFYSSIDVSFRVGDSELFKWYMAPWGPRGRAPIAFLIDDIPLGAPQGAYVNSGER